VPHHADEPCLVDEALDELGLLRQVRVQDLDRGALSDLDVFGLEDHAHAALAELAQDAVLADLAADECCVLEMRDVRGGDRKAAGVRIYLLWSVHASAWLPT
jgi:hypothetical protein